MTIRPREFMRARNILRRVDGTILLRVVNFNTFLEIYDKHLVIL